MLLRTLLIFLFFFLLARAAWRLIAGVVGGASGPSAVPPHRKASPPAVKMSQCPVCGTYVVPGKALTGMSRGQVVYYCSEACRGKHAA